jgi:hypothetical protein
MAYDLNNVFPHPARRTGHKVFEDDSTLAFLT